MSQQQQNKGRLDADLAKEQSVQVIADAVRMRTHRAIIAILLLLVGLGSFAGGQNFLAFIALGGALAFGILFFDAVGHLREVRDRPYNSLAPRVPQVILPKEVPSVGDVAETQTQQPT